MGSPATHEAMKPVRIPGQIRGDGRVFVIAIVGVKEIQLVVLAGLVMNSLSVDDYSKLHVPWSQEEVLFKAVDLAIHPLPPAAVPDEGLKTQPLPEGHLDRIAGTSDSKQGKDFLAKEGAIHAEVEPIILAHGCPNLAKQVSQESDGSFAVVNVARTVFHSEDVTCLGQISGDGIVAGYLTVMRVESTERSLHLQTCGYHRAVHINCECAKAKRANDLRDYLGVERTQTLQRWPFEVLQPAAKGPVGGQTPKTAESQKEGIPVEKSDMAQPPPSYYDKTQKEPNHGDNAVITSQRGTCQVPAYQSVESPESKVSGQQLQARIGGQARLRELDSNFSIDTTAQIGFSSSHGKWPFVGVECDGGHILQTTAEGPFARYNFTKAHDLLTN